MKTRSLFLLILLVTLVACTAQAQPTALVATAPARPVSNSANLYKTNFTHIDCPQGAGRGFGFDTKRVECGTLSVPEDRSKPDGKKITLGVTLIHPTATPAKPDPILLLLWGPSGETNFSPYFAMQNDDLAQFREVIAVDQRGVGRSSPAFNCPDVNGISDKLLGLKSYSQEYIDTLVTPEKACLKQWTSSADLTQYSTAASVADLEDLRSALNLDQWNLYAGAYGAQVALQLLRDYPQTVRTAVLDSPLPLSAADAVQQPASIERVLNLFFDDCAADVACNKAFPELKRIFYEVVDKLNGAPLSVSVSDLNSGNRYKILVDGNRLIDILLAATGDMRDATLPEMPRTIYQLRAGATDNLARLLGNLTQSFTPSTTGMEWRITCGEVVPNLSKDDWQKSISQVDTHLRDYFTQTATMQQQTCDLWKDVTAKLHPAWPAIGASSVPTLFISGDRVIGVSPDWSKNAASLLGQSNVVNMPAKSSIGGFGRSGSDCQRALATAFITDPTAKLDTACASQKPTYTWITLP